VTTKKKQFLVQKSITLNME